MILNHETLSDLRQQWAVVVRLCTSHKTFGSSTGIITETIHENIFNLSLILGYAVLDQVLDEFMKQKKFRLPSNGRKMLGDKMKASRNKLTWQDYDSVDAGKKARNNVAHKGELLDNKICLQYINAIQLELKAWNIVV